MAFGAQIIPGRVQLVQQCVLPLTLPVLQLLLTGDRLIDVVELFEPDQLLQVVPVRE